jgi:hypothetical protein
MYYSFIVHFTESIAPPEMGTFFRTQLWERGAFLVKDMLKRVPFPEKMYKFSKFGM